MSNRMNKIVLLDLREGFGTGEPGQDLPVLPPVPDPLSAGLP